MVKHTQIIRRQQPKNCLSVFDHFVGMAFKRSNICSNKTFRNFPTVFFTLFYRVKFDIEKLLKKWRLRNLTLQRNIIICQVFPSSKILFLAEVLSVPKVIIDTTQNIQKRYKIFAINHCYKKMKQKRVFKQQHIYKKTC